MTDNTRNMGNGISKLLGSFTSEGRCSSNMYEVFVLLCIAHLLKIVAEECIVPIKPDIYSFSSLTNSIKASVKLHDLFDSVRVQLG